jgi:hypothetical protein
MGPVYGGFLSTVKRGKSQFTRKRMPAQAEALNGLCGFAGRASQAALLT